MKWLGGRDPRLQLGFLALLVLAGTFPSIIAFSTQSINTSTAMMWTFVPVAYLFFGPNFAMVNNLVPASMRGQAVAIYLLTTNFANLAIAPQLVGWTSDFLAAHGHDTAASLRVALVTLAVSGFWGGLHYALAMRHIRQDTARLRAFA
jgi:dipeptide/tripeptide permease